MKQLQLLKMASFLLVVSMAISGCSSTSSPQSKVEPAGNLSPAKKVELTFWRPPNEIEEVFLKSQIAAFQSQNPNITVNMEIVPSNSYEKKIRTALATSTAPDIMGLDAPTLASYAGNGAVLPLDAYFKKEGDKDDIVKPVLESMSYKGQIFASPLADASIAIFYNKKMFQAKGVPLPSKNPEEPWTWEQWLDAARKVNDPANGVVGIETGGGFAAGEGRPFMKMPMLWQAGAEILSPDGKTAKGYLDSPQAKEALKFYASLYNTEKVSSKELPPDPFQNGKVAINFDNPYRIASIAKAYPNFKLGEDYDIAPLWKKQKQVTPNGSWSLAITKDSKNPDEAWKFIHFITGVEGAKEWYKATKNLPARLSTAKSFPDLTSYPMNIFVTQSAKYAHPRPVTMAYPAISDAIRLLFEDVALGNRNVDEAVDDAVKKIDKAIADSEKK